MDGRAAPPRTLTLAITTRERPDALDSVLRSALAQRELPMEILVADDGSGESTRAIVAGIAAAAPVPVHHLWQAHEGFRLTRLRNLAILAARGDYVVFVDGDMILHPEFIADHRRLARPGWYTQGVRIALDSQATAASLRDPLRRLSWGSRGLGGMRRVYGLHVSAIQPLMRTLANRLIAVKGCNQGFWHGDLLRVDGFEEAIEGWGPEDKELCARLRFSGVRRQTLLFGGIAWHLQHPPASRAQHTANLLLLADTLATQRQLARRGLSTHPR